MGPPQPATRPATRHSWALTDRHGYGVGDEGTFERGTMTEIPSPNGPAPTSSVVIDTDTKMPATNRGLIAAAVVAAVLVGTFVVWIVASGGDDDYEPGPVAQALSLIHISEPTRPS